MSQKSSNKSKKKLREERNRKQMIDAAEELFKEQGFEGTSMDNIAENERNKGNREPETSERPPFRGRFVFCPFPPSRTPVF